MFSLDNLYRWCDEFGGGLVIATSAEEARDKLAAYMRDQGEDGERKTFTIWAMKYDDYYAVEHPDVLDIY